MNPERLTREVELLQRRVAALESESAAATEEQPEWQSEMFQLLVDAAQELAVFGMDADGRIIRWNRGAERLLGYRADEIIGQLVTCLYPLEETRSKFPQEELDSVRSGQSTEREGLLARKDGTQFIACVTTVAVRDEDGQVEGFIRAVRDISQRRWTERILRESERRFRLFMNYNPAIGFIKDEDGRLLYVNETWEKTFSSAVGEWTGRTDDETWPPDVARTLRQHDLEALRGNEATEIIETLPTVDGMANWRIFRFSFLDSSGRRLLGGIGIDITERERGREEIQRLNQELERRVAERTAELTVANEELNAFCYSVSHDLRAPLRGIDGFSQAILEDYSDRLDAVGIDYLNRVRGEALRMGQLIDDLLELSRVSRLSLRRELIDLSRIVEEVAETLRKRDPGREVTFEIAKGPSVRADGRLMRIVLENLIGNAWKFTSKRDRARIEFASEQTPDGRTVWFVRDNGVGFKMEYASNLFGAFQRLHGNSEFPGTGIGLATVQRIIHRHGGQVWAEASPDAGATFFFTCGTSAAPPH